MEHALGDEGTLDNVVAGDGRPGAELAEEVPAQERARRLLEEHLGLPSMGHVGCRDLTHALSPEVDHFALRERAGRAVAQVVQRDVAPEAAVGHLAARSGGEPHVHGPALVGLDVTEGDPADRLHPQNRRRRLRDEREHGAGPGVKQERLIGGHEELVEGKPLGADLGDEGGDPVDAVGDFVHGRLHGFHAPMAFRPTGSRSVRNERPSAPRHRARARRHSRVPSGSAARAEDRRRATPPSAWRSRRGAPA